MSITEVDVAAIKGQLDRPVSGYMKLRVAVAPDTPVSECERILVEQGEGCVQSPRRECHPEDQEALYVYHTYDTTSFKQTTFDYNTTEWEMSSPFECRCRSDT